MNRTIAIVCVILLPLISAAFDTSAQYQTTILLDGKDGQKLKVTGIYDVENSSVGHLVLTPAAGGSKTWGIAFNSGKKDSILSSDLAMLTTIGNKLCAEYGMRLKQQPKMVLRELFSGANPGYSGLRRISTSGGKNTATLIDSDERALQTIYCKVK
jgi:hypothetical protein